MEFLVELYVARDDHATARRHVERAERAAAELSRDGQVVRCVRSIFVPEDETCLLLFAAPSVAAVRESLDRAGLRPEHVSAASSPDAHSCDLRGPTGQRTTSPPDKKGGAPMPTISRADTTVDGSSPLEELKAKQQMIWSSGDYGRIAWLTVPLARELGTAVGLRPGARVLDVACGTGHVALEAARTFCDVTGIDYVPALVETARRRAAAEGLDVGFHEADAEQLPFPDASFDYVLSAIGVMFTADHERAAAELARVCRPGGRIGLASWTPTGFIGQLLTTVGRHAPPPPAAKPPTRWGAEESVRELLGDRVSELAARTAVVTQRFRSAEHFADFFLAHYGPTRAAAGRLDDAGRAALRHDMVELAERSGERVGGTLVVDWEYLVVTATRT